MSYLKWLFVCLLALQIGDGYTTWYGLSHGLAREGNPLVSWVSSPIALVMIAKGLCIALLAHVARRFMESRRRELCFAFAALSCYYGAVVANNLIVLA